MLFKAVYSGQGAPRQNQGGSQLAACAADTVLIDTVREKIIQCILIKTATAFLAAGHDAPPSSTCACACSLVRFCPFVSGYGRGFEKASTYFPDLLSLRLRKNHILQVCCGPQSAWHAHPPLCACMTSKSAHLAAVQLTCHTHCQAAHPEAVHFRTHIAKTSSVT